MPASTLLLAGAALVAVSLMPTPARAAVTVIGSGLARICYEAAESGRATSHGFENCDRALAEQALFPAMDPLTSFEA